MEKVKMAFLSVVVLFFFLSCGASKEADAGTSRGTEGEVIQEGNSDPEIQAPEHPEGLQFVDVVPGEWSVVLSDEKREELEREAAESPDADSLGFQVFNKDFTVDYGDLGGVYKGSWSYDEMEHIFQYEINGMIYRFKVLSYQQNEMKLQELIDHLDKFWQERIPKESLKPETWIKATD
ncbi:hypothetical protein [Sediminispirochaeta bajacaliforniensis]|uniref:hypothetical protein n=1 Tax=Sediminispirochaeta bajacaliforniensis TaxID=148 RepID=UPI0003804155|nr:hypothetical protein [Sediminispirochaeta bajacaliforniensis]